MPVHLRAPWMVLARDLMSLGLSRATRKNNFGGHDQCPHFFTSFGAKKKICRSRPHGSYTLISVVTQGPLSAFYSQPAAAKVLFASSHIISRSEERRPRTLDNLMPRSQCFRYLKKLKILGQFDKLE